MQYKTETDLEPGEERLNLGAQNVFSLPQGLFGFPELKKMEIIFQ